MTRGTQDQALETTIVVTGFEPFGGHARNPSEEVARSAAAALREAGWPRARAEALEVTYRAASGYAAGMLEDRSADEGPVVVVHVGLAAGLFGADFALEVVAHNLRGAVPDNEGVAAGEGRALEPLVSGAALARRGELPVGRLQEALGRKGLRAKLSLDAGLYVCNAIYFHTLEALERGGHGQRALFVHVPMLDETMARSRGQALGEALDEALRGEPGGLTVGSGRLA